MNFPNLRPSTRAQGVRDQIVRAIDDGTYGPGDRLPSESELVEAMGVSRASVREALRSLEVIGLLDIRHGRGTFVCEGPGEQYVAQFTSWLYVHRGEVLDLMNVRGALDELSASGAADRRDTNRVVAIAEAHQRFKSAAASTTDLDELVRLDIAFHVEIANASGSLLLPRLLGDLNEMLNDSRRVLFALPNRATQSAAEHETIVDAITRGDSAAAREAAASHLRSSRDLLADPDLVWRKP